MQVFPNKTNALEITQSLIHCVLRCNQNQNQFVIQNTKLTNDRIVEKVELKFSRLDANVLNDSNANDLLLGQKITIFEYFADNLKTRNFSLY